MKFHLALLLASIFLPMAKAEESRFFRIAGPVVSTITAFSADGYVTWTNVPTNATFTVQTAVSLFGPSNWVDYIHVPATNPATTHRLYDPNPPDGMALIPAGSFTMGDILDGDPKTFPRHPVYVSAFYMDRYEVTKKLWDDVYQWATNNGYNFGNAGSGKAATQPVQTVSWYDCVKWCNARSEKAGLVPAYYMDTGQTTIYRMGTNALQESFVKWNAGYRLPTEAEWEKAARGGANGQRFPWSNTSDITHSMANYHSATSPRYPYDVSPTPGYHPTFNDGVQPYTSPVGFFAPNCYGLYDMTGNVWEWCWDWYGGYSSNSQTDPRGPASGSIRVLRGGSWNSGALNCVTACRTSFDPTSEYGNYGSGFRSALPAGQ